RLPGLCHRRRVAVAAGPSPAGAGRGWLAGAGGHFLCGFGAAVMSTKKWTCLLAAAAALGGATCAPVPSPPGSETPAPAHADPDVERLPMPPPAQAKGLKDRIEMAVEHVRSRDLLTTNGFWTVFHGLLGLGPSTTLLNPETHERVNALDYIC